MNKSPSAELIALETGRPRTGLVLEGGGAKGAYAFGWLLEFAARGIHFDAVSGTSVGTLNAILWATNQLDKGEMLWQTISTETVLAHRRPRILRFSIAFLYAMRRLVAERLSNARDNTDSTYAALFIALITFVPVIWLVTEGLQQLIFGMLTVLVPSITVSKLSYRLAEAIQITVIFMSVILSVIYLVTPKWDRLLTARLTRTIPNVADRICFVPRLSYEDFLRLNASVDVLLDPIHFGGGNTSYEAFAFGVPIVTLPSQFLRGRITHALYQKLDVFDCVAQSPQEYAEMAVRLGTDSEFRHAVSEKILARNDRLYEETEAVRELERFFHQAMDARGL